MKAYRFELRKKMKWEWGFWTIYGFNCLLWGVVGIILDTMIPYFVVVTFSVIIILIMAYDLVGYKIRRNTPKHKKKSEVKRK